MDILEDFVTCMDSDEKLEFKYFLGMRKDETKELAMFEAVCNIDEKINAELIAKIYSPPIPGACRTMRSRLGQKLSNYIAFLCMQNGGIHHDGEAPPISVARWFINRNAPDLAKRFLQRNEKYAIKNQMYHLLDAIYSFLLMHAHVLDMDYVELRTKWLLNNELHTNMQKLDAYLVNSNKRNIESKRNGTTLDPRDLMKNIFTEFNIADDARGNSSFMLKVVEICRSAVISAKEYPVFEPFLLDIYENLKNVNAFADAQAENEYQFIYIISHTFYRNRKFQQSQEWTEKLAKVLIPKKLLKHKLYAKYIGICAANFSFTGRNQEAIQLITETCDNNEIKLSKKDWLDLQLNLAVYHFQSGEFKVANKINRGIGSNNAALKDVKGLEWLFKKQIIECIIQYELGRMEIVHSSINSILDGYEDFLKREKYQFAATFLKLILKMIEFPEAITSKDFAEEVSALSKGWPDERLDIQAITFFCWMKSKMKNRDYYEVLLEWMSR